MSPEGWRAYRLLRPLLFLLPPEAAHRLAMAALRAGGPLLPLLSPWLTDPDPRHARVVMGLRFPNPVGLAAGFDKAAEAPDAWPRLGFGFMELGTFTALAQPGNPRPRVFRYPAQKALINSMGFNNPGAREAARRLGRLRESGRWPACPVGINLGKSKVTPLEGAVDDYLLSLEALLPHADYLTVNVSSPNTPGLRGLQEARPLKKLLKAVVRGAGRVPVLLKLAPDLEEKPLKQAAAVALECGCRGLIATNTTLARPGLPPGSHPPGGLSGLPLRGASNRALKVLARFTRGRAALVASGGVFTARDMKEKMDLGADLVQVYTGFIYEGPGMVRRLLRNQP